MTAEFADVNCPIDNPALIERRYRRQIIRRDSATLMPRVQVVCFAAAVHPAMAKEQRLVRCWRPVQRVLSATLDNPAAYRPPVCLSFRNDRGRTTGRKPLHTFRS